MVPSDVPWVLIAPWVGATEFIEFDVVVTRVHDEKLWFVQRTVVIRGVPVSVALAPAGRVGLGGELAARVVCSNPLADPLTGAVLTLSGGPGLLIGGVEPSEEIPLGTIQPGDTVTIVRSLTASLEGEQMFTAHLFAEGAAPGDAFATITVGACAGDFNRDTVLNSQDYFDFLIAYFEGC